MSFFRTLGRIVGRGLAVLGIKAVRSISDREPPSPPPPPPMIPPAAAVLLIAALGVSLMGTTCAPQLGEFGAGVAEGAVDCLRRPDLCVPRTPTATPSASATASPGGCQLAPDGCNVCCPWPGGAMSCTTRFCPSPTSATPTPTRTAAATATPTATPTTSPSPTPVPTQDGCLDISSVPAAAVPAVQDGPCGRGFTRIDLVDMHLCMRYWHCADGNDRFNCPTRVYDNVVTFHNIIPMKSDGMLHDPGRPRTDALCRNIDDNGNVIYPGPEPDGYVPAPWERAGICRPLICAETPTPTPSPAPGPLPTPPPVPQPADFRLNFVNTCSALHYTKRMPDGSLRGECDGTYRFIGTLASGERWGNACDTDHFRCAREACPGISAEEIAQHRKTYELCGGRDWDSPLGVELHVDGARFEKKAENPFQHYVYGDGSPVQIYGCLPAGARTHDGLTIPVNGEGCGGRKTVTWDEAHE